MQSESGNIYALAILVGCLLVAVLAASWLGAIAFFVLLVLFNLVTRITSNLFRWPVEKMAVPLAHRVQTGRGRGGAVLGLLAVALLLVPCAVFVGDYYETGVRRLGQNLSQAKERLGTWGDTLDAYAARELGRSRFQRWVKWLWEQDARRDDTRRWLRSDAPKIPAAAFRISAGVNAGRDALTSALFGSGGPGWFSYAYWFAAAVLAPSFTAMFFVTIYQLSARRLFATSSNWEKALLSLTAPLLLLILMAAFYLCPFVSHPYHTPEMPFWLPLSLYAVAGTICCGVLRINQKALFSLAQSACEGV